MIKRGDCIILIIVLVAAMILCSGCVASNEFVPVTPSQVIPSIQQGMGCTVVIEGAGYNALSKVCSKIIINQTNWVKFCEEKAEFPICEVRE